MTTQAPDLEPSAPQTTSSQTQAPAAPAFGSRCRYRYKNGRHCRLPGSEPQLGLCPRHFRERLAAGLPAHDDFADLSKDLLHGPLEFSSAKDLSEYLTRLLVLMTKGGVSPRRGAVLAYTCSLLLRTLSAIQQQEGGKNQTIIVDIDSAVARRALEAQRAQAAQRPETVSFYERLVQSKLSRPSPEPDTHDRNTSNLDNSK